MNTDKENINKMPTKSKIPLPIDPLPMLSENVLKTRRNSESDYRHPLKTINNQQQNLLESAGSSKTIKKVFNTSIQPMKLDTRHVTVRQKNEDCSWDYRQQKDRIDEEKNKERSSVISISDDEDYSTRESSREIRYFAKHKKNNLSNMTKVATPTLSSLEASGVRNVKKSLKRPHSRELQGLPSFPNQEVKGDDKYKRRLNFNDRLQDTLKSPDYSKKLYMTCLCRDYTFDMFTYLLESEDKPVIPRIPSVTRACVINWLLKVNGADGNPTTVQTAWWYLDSVLGVGHVQLVKLQLVAAACYWISQKLHGPSMLASRLVKCANRAFSTEQLMAAEKAVLKKLKFPRHPVVPHDYITYLSWWCDSEHPGEIEVAATFLCTSGAMVSKALCDEYPSVLAAAAVFNALILLKRKELIKRLQTCLVFQISEKKSSNMSFVCSVQRKAVRLMYDPTYEYKAPFELYGCGPHYIAQKVINSAFNLATTDTRIKE